MTNRAWDSPQQIFEEYRIAKDYKASVGRRGICEQAKINERFYVGDQWNGVKCGEEKPLLRYNIIKRIGDYKMAMMAGAALAVNFSAEGVPNTKEMQDHVLERKELYRQANNDQSAMPEGTVPEAEEINMVMDALGSYHKVTAERVRFDDIKTVALRKAYTSGTGILYTYWDQLVKTGQYADEAHTSPVTGDIRCEALDVENVFFGDPHVEDVQEQPYIIIAQRRSVDELQREARRYHRRREDVENIKPDRDDEFYRSDVQDEPSNMQKATVLTKFYKQWNEDGTSYAIYAVRVVRGATVRPKWNIGIRMYPLAVMPWERVTNCIYGASEVTHIVPNQIAINRAITASASAVMMMGMPIMVVNEDVVTQNVTNDPGQIIPVNGTEDLSAAIRYVAPQNFTPQFDNLLNSMIANTMTQAGANDAALGNMRPDNTSAIIAVREAATMPMQLLQNRFYSFVEDVARIWAEFWVCLYGQRSLKMKDEKGEWYMPFDGEKYRDIIINARVDVGPASLWSEIASRQTLDNLFAAQLITREQYLARLPKGSVPDQTGLLRDLEKEQQAAQAPTAPMGGGMPTPAPQEGASVSGQEMPSVMPDMAQIVQMLPEESRQKFMQLSDEEKQMVAARMMGG